MDKRGQVFSGSSTGSRIPIVKPKSSDFPKKNILIMTISFVALAILLIILIFYLTGESDTSSNNDNDEDDSSTDDSTSNQISNANSCDDGTKMGQCSRVYPGMYCASSGDLVIERSCGGSSSSSSSSSSSNNNNNNNNNGSFCILNCTGKQCGSDGCGGVCGPVSESCLFTSGTCTNITGTKTCSNGIYG
ncbi:MAG: hypothetical protein AABW81_03735, partial [Nanoarchaeota archaeon]